MRIRQSVWQQIRCRSSDGRLLDIVIKVVPESHYADTENSALQYLAEHSPGFSGPKPHGLIRLRGFVLMFMSYMPSTTLKDVCPKLTVHHKVSIQGQLDCLFTQLRSIKLPLGGRLGGTAGEGVSDSHAWVEHADNETVIQTALGFRDFQFAIESPTGPEYCNTLKNLLPLPDPNEPAVFTHGDVYPGNITVDIDSANLTEYVVTGIIDWDESGFYPAWFEVTKVLYNFKEYYD
ncbi:hypothetical protein Sste5346_001727 [Sporothrix stenoceras]|uniref:Aminoglycoside phosphotransferase domain-containing protein n=1 Tax=Sporothrix stenoceras TaxID=5173 RepID=A0ABR3ZMD2_9PEZI